MFPLTEIGSTIKRRNCIVDIRSSSFKFFLSQHGNAHNVEESICFKLLLFSAQYRRDISEKLIEIPVSIFVELKCWICERSRLLSSSSSNTQKNGQKFSLPNTSSGSIRSVISCELENSLELHRLASISANTMMITWWWWWDFEQGEGQFWHQITAINPV